MMPALPQAPPLTYLPVLPAVPDSEAHPGAHTRRSQPPDTGRTLHRESECRRGKPHPGKPPRKPSDTGRGRTSSRHPQYRSGGMESPHTQRDPSPYRYPFHGKPGGSLPKESPPRHGRRARLQRRLSPQPSACSAPSQALPHTSSSRKPSVQGHKSGQSHRPRTSPMSP